jgi:hypothetical protein
MWKRLLLGLAVVFALGCGSSKFVPVSGKVTLNGQPLANATVAFQPTGDEQTIETGPGSSGKTNENGEYTLTVATGKKGAVVGKHRVLISTVETNREDDQRPQRGDRSLVNRVPSRYGMGGKDELFFVVPSEGTNKANFTLTAP